MPVSTVVGPIYIPTDGERGFLFTSSSPAPIFSRLLVGGRSNGCELIPCGFVLHFPDDE